MKKKIVWIVILLFLIGAASGALFLITRDHPEDYCLASELDQVPVFDEELMEQFFPRGTTVSVSEKIKKIDGEEFRIFTLDEKKYYVKEKYLCETTQDCVKETELYTLRKVAVLNEIDDVSIAGMFDKNIRVNVTGHSEVLPDGSVEYYEVSDGNTKGFVKGDYLALSFFETAYDASAYASYLDYGGGEPSELAYYPKDEVSFEGNVMPEKVKSLYINAEGVKNVDEYIRIASSCGINAFVVDIKDCYIDTQLAYDSKVMKEYAPSTTNIVNSFEDYQSALKKLKDNGFYLIGRITAFKDDSFAKDNPEEAIFTLGTPYVYGMVQWPSVYSRKMWEYDLALAYEAVEEMGFNEIQFDYVRFPEYVPEDAEVHNEYGETPAQAITEFLRYASERLHHIDTYLSADVFGETSGGSTTQASCFVTGYGQFWPAISNAADVISSMPYPDHFSAYSFNIAEPWANPGSLMSAWAKATAQCQKITYDPAIVRTWIQAQSSDSYGIYYGEKEIADQIEALDDFGGYMTWNSPSSLYFYELYSPAFK